MASVAAAPIGPSTTSIRQSTRQTRTNPSRLSKTAAAGRSSLSHAAGGSSGGAGSSGLTSMLNAQQRLNNNTPHGIYPGITHFTDTISAIPREFRRHESLLKEVDGKSWALEERLPVFVSAAAERVMMPAKNGERPGEESIHPSKTAGVQTEHAEITARRQLFQHIRNTLSDLLPTMDEKNHVARNANKELKKQIQRLEIAYSHVQTEVSEEVRLGNLNHWAYSNKTIGKPGGPADRPRRETAGGRERNAGDEASRDTRKHRRAQADPDADDSRPGRKSHGNTRNKAEAHDQNTAATSGAAGGQAKRRKVEKPQATPSSAAMERTVSTNTASGRGSAKDTAAADKRKGRAREVTTTTQRKRTNTVTSAAASPTVLVSPLVPLTGVSGKAASPAPSVSNRPQSSRVQQATQATSNGRQRPSSSASNRAQKKATHDGRDQPGPRSALASAGNIADSSLGSPLLPSKPVDSNLKREEAIGVHQGVGRPAAIQTSEVVSAAPSKGRSSKTSTPAVATFAEAHQPPPRSRPLRSTEGGGAGKRSHKKGAGSISRQAAIMAAEDEDSSRQGDDEDDEREPRYCYCNQVSFGEMVACDMDNCPREWFHLSCVGMTKPPSKSMKWYCNECKETLKKSKSGGSK